MRDIKDIIKATEEAFDFQRGELEGTSKFSRAKLEQDKKEAVTFLSMFVEKKPNMVMRWKKDNSMLIGFCPLCTLNVFDPYSYCPNCGQKLNWNT